MGSAFCRYLSACHLLAVAALGAADFEDSFSAPEIDGKWEVSGAVALDQEQVRGDGGASLRLEHGGKAVLKLREADASGTLSLWVYDDRTAPANPKAKRGGPLWGLMKKDGGLLVTGSIYARYLSGATTFATAEFKPPKEQPANRVQYLGVKRKSGWHRWTFDMDAEKGFSISMDGKRLKRFDWDKTKFHGFSGVVLLGDSKAEDAQTLWVDDVQVTLGPPMQAKPTPPPPPPPVVPDKDPELTEAPVELVPEVRGVHPRLFFGPDDIPALREKALSPAMKVNWDDLLGYLEACNPPKHTKFLKDATDGQRQGLWRMPTVALHYVVTGDKKSFNKAVGFMKLLLGLEHWETTGELDAGMSSANIMIGAAICYDFLYNDLDPDFREQFRQKLLLMGRAQYHGGHLNKNKTNGYWQGDPANNHRWHRNAGFSLAILTAYEGNPSEQWILTKLAKEFEYVTDWLPPDGTSHEGPTYLVFGMPHLTLGLMAVDRCLGTRYMDRPFAQNVARFKLQTITPGFTNGFQFGDSSGVGGYNHFLWAFTGRHKQSHVQIGLKRLQANNEKAFQFGWMGVLWQDPTVDEGGDLAQLETTSFFPDLQTAFLRDSWEDDGVAAMFRCGPFGGLLLNEYRNTHNMKYINVAHDDPDANSFMLFSQRQFLTESDRYSKRKRSANHNTLLVNGQGQKAGKRPEGKGWSQPDGNMLEMAYVTGWKDAGDTVIVEGEAGGSYKDAERFRRTFVWVRGEYILVLDDMQALKEVDYTWLLQAPELVETEATADSVSTYELRKGEAACPVAVIADREVSGAIKQSTADHRGKSLGWQQLHLSTTASAWRMVSIYDPWRRGDVQIKATWHSPEAATVTVTGQGIDDTWEWRLADDLETPSSLQGRAVLDLDSLPPEE